jgi:hypothetical protein
MKYWKAPDCNLNLSSVKLLLKTEGRKFPSAMTFQKGKRKEAKPKKEGKR